MSILDVIPTLINGYDILGGLRLVAYSNNPGFNPKKMDYVNVS